MSNIVHFAGRSLQSAMLFSTLPEDVQRFLRDQSPVRRFDDGQIIQQRGDEGDGFWLIEEGAGTVGQFLPDGEFRGVARLGPGDSYGELAVLTRRPRVVDAVSRGQSSVRFIRADLFEGVIANRPDAMRPMLGALSAQLQEMIDVIGGLRKGTSLARVAGMLATLAVSQVPPVEIAITQDELANLLGLSRATVNTALRELQRQGLIERRYGQLAVLDREGLSLVSLG
uniref:Crp/Fnr family transcriptional regulator n=1 Tax=Parerythrobacter lutipelagi TaxID=1964208 RepID=UPI0010F56F2A|nr:Crp/Fnr family transcriptional regulator [Parerythrobacter lutipelagi]